MFSPARLALREFSAPNSWSVIVTLFPVMVTAKAGGALVNAPVAKTAAAAAATVTSPPATLAVRRGWLSRRWRVASRAADRAWCHHGLLAHRGDDRLLLVRDVVLTAWRRIAGRRSSASLSTAPRSA
jgi:hypothetical protein